MLGWMNFTASTLPFPAICLRTKKNGVLTNLIHLNIEILHQA